jgi:hypothetical protein
VWPDAPGGALSDREFLATALEILETPASPVNVAFLWIICALVFVALVWAYFGRIDIIASAQGKFQLSGRVKVIEPVETGRVAAIHAANDSPVKSALRISSPQSGPVMTGGKDNPKGDPGRFLQVEMFVPAPISTS